MKKLIMSLIVALSLVATNSCWSDSSSIKTGPFGLYMGMKVSDFKEGQLEKIVPYVYKISIVPNPHSDFKYYLLMIGPKAGLCCIYASGKTINTSVYGTDLKTAFKEMQEGLTKVYGTPDSSYDFLESGSVWNESNDWMVSLFKKERFLSTFWKGSSLKNNINYIRLEADVLSFSEGFISVKYEFTNFELFQKKMKILKNKSL